VGVVVFGDAVEILAVVSDLVAVVAELSVATCCVLEFDVDALTSDVTANNFSEVVSSSCSVNSMSEVFVRSGVVKSSIVDEYMTSVEFSV
jgi:hypothetical protein